MASLADALAWAARGFKVFPLVPLGKLPAVAAFQRVATDDPAIISAWWRDPVTFNEYDYNIGVLTNDLVVVDVDLKSGKPGLESYRELGGHFDTLVVNTPSGGYHCYFYGPDSRLRVGLRPGVDIRSHNGYVVAPGSYVIDLAHGVDGEYTVYADEKIALVPDRIEAELQEPNAPRDKEAHEAIEEDTPTAIAQAIEWLKYQAPAVEGQGGDNLTFRVAAKLTHDYALTLETTFSLMVGYWNERCVPPWEAGELWRKIENADEYASGEAGAARAEAFFNGVTVPEGTAPIRRQEGVYFGNAYDARDVPERPWLVDRFLLTTYLTLLGATGGAGKSTASLTVAAHLALGRDIGDYHTRYPVKSIIYNAEDDIMEQTRRLLAICTAYEFDYDAVRSKIILLSRDEFPLILATSVKNQPLANEPHIAALINMASPPDVGFVGLDPLVDIHGCNENDPIDMRFVMGLITRIAREAKVAVLITHHTVKPSGSANARARAGDIDTLRGSSAIPNACRIGMTLYGATAEDIERLGVPEHERHLYIRLDDGKQNLAEKNPYGVWFKWQSVKLFSGDRVGVFVPINIRDKEDERRYAVANILRESIVSSGVGSISLQAAAMYLQAQDDLYAKLSVTTVRRMIQRLFGRPTKIENDTLQIERITAPNGKESVLLKLT